MMKYLNLIRYKNLIFIAFLQCLLFYSVASPLMQVLGLGNAVPAAAFWLMLLGEVLVAAAGYVVNDYFDTKIDALNRPERVIVGESVSRDEASRLYQVLMGLGIACGLGVALWARSLSIALIFVLVPGLLWFYSASYKRQFLVGNLIVAFCVALSVLLVAELASAFPEKLYGEAAKMVGVTYNLYRWIGGFAVFAALLTLVSEVVKDLVDEFGDREQESRTMPVVWGKRKTRIFLYALIAVIVFALFAAVSHVDFPAQEKFVFLSYTADMLTFRYALCAVVAPLLVEVFLLARAKKVADYAQAAGFVKFIMFAGAFYSVIFYFLLSRTYGIRIFDLFLIK